MPLQVPLSSFEWSVQRYLYVLLLRNRKLVDSPSSSRAFLLQPRPYAVTVWSELSGFFHTTRLPLLTVSEAGFQVFDPVALTVNVPP